MDLMKKTYLKKFIFQLIDDLCHEIVYHKHKQINYDIMIDLVINTIVDLINK